MKLNLKLIDIVMKLSNNEKIPDNDYDEIKNCTQIHQNLRMIEPSEIKMDLNFYEIPIKS